MIGLTPIQSSALTYIKRRIEHDGVAPSYEEIGRAIGISAKSNVHRIIGSLEERGHIRRGMPGHARALEVVGPRDQAIRLVGEMDEADLRELLAVAAGRLAEREGVSITTQVLGRIADRLPRGRA